MTKFVTESVKPEIQDFILDSELVAYDVVKDKIMPFQALTQRSKKNVTDKDLETHICICAFDLLYLNGKPLIKEDFVTRRDILHQTFNEIPHKFMFAKKKDAKNFEDIDQFLQESIQDCCEGLMVKTLDVNATYEPSKRSFNWLKLKKDYLDSEIGDSIDLVVVGADYGTGKRTGWFGSFLLACWDEDSEMLQTVCKIGTGFSDEALKTIHEQLSEIIVDNAPSQLK